MKTKSRKKNIYNNVKEELDAIIIKNSSYPYIDDNFYYVTGLEIGLFENSVAVLYPDGNVSLIVSELESESARRTDLNLNVYKSTKEFQSIFKRSISSLKTIGINFNGVTHSDFRRIMDLWQRLDFVDVSEAFITTRLVKDEFEIETIQKACEIADKVMGMIPKILHSGVHEFEIAAEIIILCRKMVLKNLLLIQYLLLEKTQRSHIIAMVIQL